MFHFSFRSCIASNQVLISPDEKDCAILMLLPWSIKAPKLRPNERRVPVNASKRRKEESEEDKAEKKKIRETFIVRVEVNVH